MAGMDLQQFRLEHNSGVIVRPRNARIRRHYKRFLKGPIDWVWLCKAAKLPGKAFLVGIAVHHMAGLTGKPVLKISKSVLKDLGISRQAYYMGLKSLEQSGLIAVERSKGSIATISILDR